MVTIRFFEFVCFRPNPSLSFGFNRLPSDGKACVDVY